MTADNKVTINGKEFDVRDFSPEQTELLNAVALADSDLYKMRVRLAVQQTGRDALFNQLTQTLETTESNDK